MEVGALPYKLGEFVAGEWRGYRHKDEYDVQPGPDGEVRFCIGSKDPFQTFVDVVAQLDGPVRMLVVLHTPREKDRGGRYESPDRSIESALGFLHRFRAAFERDARADVWIISQSSLRSAAYEKHDRIFVCDPPPEFEANLVRKGFRRGLRELPLPHTHHYREEFDVDFLTMFDDLEWTWSPLEPGDGD